MCFGFTGFLTWERSCDSSAVCTEAARLGQRVTEIWRNWRALRFIRFNEEIIVRLFIKGKFTLKYLSKNV